MRALILIEHINGTVSESAFELAALAKSAGAECQGVICAGDTEVVNALASQLKGFDSAIGVADAALEHYNSAAYLRALATVIDSQSPDVVITSYSTAGIDLAPALSQSLDRPMLGYVTALVPSDAGLSATSQVYGGKLMATTTVPLPVVISVMPGAVKPDGSAGEAPSPAMTDVEFSSEPVRVKEIIEPDTSGVNLAEAEKIVCVGRALGGTEKLPLAEELAAALAAEIAGSRPVIDAGWLPKIRQVGKSGTKVKPRLYFMAGVSGAPEHLEGMESSELIIAINSDEQAPIFRKAHYGAVCDMFQFIPALTERVKAGNS